jgi:hypothetical protein
MRHGIESGSDKRKIFFYLIGDTPTITHTFNTVLAKKVVDYLQDLIESGEDKKLIKFDEDFEAMIEGKFPTLEEFKNK